MHEIAFADAARPTRVACLRLNLRDYSLGHELLLQREENPLLILSPDDFNKLDLALQILSLKRAVLICSQTWRENQRPHRWLRLWNWLCRHSDYPAEIAIFRNYLEAGRRLLPRPTEEADIIANGEREERGRAFGAPFLAQLYNFIAPRLRTEPWDVSYAFSAALYFTHLESEGVFRIENLREAEISAEMDGHRAAVAAEESQPLDKN